MPTDRRFLIPVFLLIVIIGGGCPPAQRYITPPSFAVARQIFSADGQGRVMAYGMMPLKKEWECAVPHGHIVGVGKYVWVTSFSEFRHFMINDAVNHRLLALDPATGRGVRARGGEMLAAGERFVIMRDGRVFEVDSVEQVGELAMSKSELHELTSNYQFAVAGDGFMDATPRSLGSRLSLARRYELPSGKRRWDFVVGPEREHEVELVGVEGDVVAWAELGAERTERRVLAVRGFDAVANKEVWRGDEAVRALVAGRGRGWNRTYLPRMIGTMPGQLAPMVTEAETLDVGKGVVERHRVPGFVERMLAESTVADPPGGVASVSMQFYEVDALIVAVRVDQQQQAFVECYLRDGTRQWRVDFAALGMPWNYSMSYPRNAWSATPLFRDGAGRVITFGAKGPVVIDVRTGKREPE